MKVNHLQNLELLKRFGGGAWKRTLERAEVMKERLDKQSEVVRENISVINKKRRQEQLSVGQQLASLENKYGELITQNHVLALERYNLDRKVKKIKYQQ